MDQDRRAAADAVLAAMPTGFLRRIALSATVTKLMVDEVADEWALDVDFGGVDLGEAKLRGCPSATGYVTDLSHPAAEDLHAVEQAEEIARERLRTEGNRKARRAAEARARGRGRG